MGHYLLGTSDAELRRLELQDEVWGPVTESFLDRLGVGPGVRCLDVGCGPGFVTRRLLSRVGESGSVTALDPSDDWHAVLRERVGGAANVTLVRSTVQEARLEPESFDLVWLRWVLSFFQDIDGVITDLARLLAPGGVLAVQDYNHQGLSVFPESEGFKAMVRATRRAYVNSGGDPWVAARLRGPFRRAGLEVCDWHPNVLAGPPGSGVARWLDEFFRPQCDNLAEKGALSPEDKARFLREWTERHADPDAVFFSPIVLDAAARKPG